MLFVGLYVRIHEYGLTENRYALGALALWLLGISLYFIITKSKNIKVIPMSLSALFFITLIGPWGAYQLSLKSQLLITKEFLEKNRIIEGTLIQKNANELSLAQRKDISSTIYYLIENHGIESLKSIFGDQFIKSLDIGLSKEFHLFSGLNSSHSTTLFLNKIGIKYASIWQNNWVEKSFYSNLKENVLDLSQYESLFFFNFNYQQYENGIDCYKLKLDLMKKEILIFKKEDLLIAIPLNSFIKNIYQGKTLEEGASLKLNTSEMSLNLENERVKIKIIFEDLKISKLNSGFKIEPYSHGVILIKEKKK